MSKATVRSAGQHQTGGVKSRFPKVKPISSGKKAKRGPEPAAGYVPGFYTALMRKHDFPPGFTSQIERDAMSHLQAAAAAERERQSAAGIGWASGTITMANTPKHRKPGWM